MADDGKTERGACGHLVRYVFNQFAVCTVKGCDGKVACPKCGTIQVAPFHADGLPEGAWHCLPNGHCWWTR